MFTLIKFYSSPSSIFPCLYDLNLRGTLYLSFSSLDGNQLRTSVTHGYSSETRSNNVSPTLIDFLLEISCSDL